MAATATDSESIDIVARYIREAFNGRNYDAVHEMLTEDFVQHGPMDRGEIHGPEGAEELLRMFHAAFPDLEAEAELSFANEDGTYVCTHYTYRGTHDGELMGIPATGISAEIAGTNINRIENGRIAESWVLSDFLGLLQQLEVVPEMGA